MTSPVWRSALRLAQALEPETAHHVGLWLLRRCLIPDYARKTNRLCSEARVQGIDLGVKLHESMRLVHPIGLAAGFDKDARAMQGIARMGFSFMEVGALTPVAQGGNNRPRLFRLHADRALINRMGFNNGGFAAALPGIAAYKGESLLGVNLGANASSQDKVADYQAGMEQFSRHAAFLTLNLSSPNTPGLRSLQSEETFARIAPLLGDKNIPPVWLKIAPDLKEATLETILANAGLFAGLIVSNTTTARSGLRSARAGEKGGLSGAPLFARSTALLRDIARASEGKLPLIGVGGVEDARTAYEKILHGAWALQLYTGLIYNGPGIVVSILRGLIERLAVDGFKDLGEARGKKAEDT